MSKLLPLFLQIGACAAVTCVTGVPDQVAVGMLGNATYDLLKKIPGFRRLRPLGEPNHHLQRALARAISKASRDVELEKLIRDATRSLADLDPPHHYEVEQFLHDLNRRPEEVLQIDASNVELKAFLEDPDRRTFAPLAGVLGERHLPGLDPKLRTTVLNAIHLQIAARFWDEIKSDDQAWRAYSAEVFTEIRGQLDSLGQGQHEILSLLKQRQESLEAAPAIPPDLSDAIEALKSPLLAEFRSLHEKVDEILGSLGLLHGKVDQLLSQAGGPSQPVPHQLPPGAETFFGRASQRQSLAARLAAGKSAAVLGPAGMGKTALAAQVLVDLFGNEPGEASHRVYPDGIVLLDLYSLRAEEEAFWSALANTLGGPFFLQNESAEACAREACRKRRCLIVIEGAEEAHGRDGKPTLTRLREVLCTENRLLILTRDSDQTIPAATIKVTEQLEPEEAGDLFDALAGDGIPPATRTAMLELLDGHPLALTWAASLLGRGDESPERLARDWQAATLPPLHDPERAEHTLSWLFDRSTRGLTDETRRLLHAAGLLARAPFPLALIEAAPGTGAVREGLRKLVQRGLLRRGKAEDHWEFTHVLGYRFARDAAPSDATLRVSLADFLTRHLNQSLSRARTTTEILPLGLPLQHAASILLTDEEPGVFWATLANPLLYDLSFLLQIRGRLDLSAAAISAVENWLHSIPREVLEEQEWQRELSVCQNHLGDVAVAQGKLDEAARRYAAGLLVREKLAEADPGNTQWQRDLSISHDNLGDVARAQGKLDEAARRYAAGLLVDEKLAETDSCNSQSWRGLSISHERLGNVAVAQGKLDEAARRYAAGLLIREKLAEADPGNTQWQRDLSVSHNKLGDLAVAQSKLDEAARRYTAGLLVAEKLAEADPGNTQWQRDLSISHDNLGDVARAQGKLDEAARRYAAGLLVREKLAEADPGNTQWQRDLAISHERMGDMALQGDDLETARDSFQKSLAIRNPIGIADPSNAACQREQAVPLARLADIAERESDLETARRYWRAAHDTLAGIQQRGLHLSPGDERWLAALRSKIDGPV